MKKIIDVLQEVMEGGFEQAGYDKKFGFVTVSNRPDLCQYQCNGAMAAAKQYKMAPFQIAEKVVEAVKDGPFLSKDDFWQRTKVSKSVIDVMDDLGILGELPESNQLSLFDFS